MKKNASENIPSFQFYPMDWLGDVNLRMCSPAARGLWIDLMCIMTRTSNYGQLAVNNELIGVSSLVKLTGIPFRTLDKLLNELLTNGVARKDENGIIYSKRMIKDQALRLKRKEVGKLGGNPNLVNQKVNQDLNPLVGKNIKQNTTPSSSFSSSTSTSKKKKHIAGSKEKPLPAVKEFIDFAFNTFKDKFGLGLKVEGGKDGAITKSLLKTYSLEELKTLWQDSFLPSEDKFILDAGKSIGIFSNQINKLITAKNKSKKKLELAI